ncbi:MAG: hypothetical protein QF872_08975, partial [Gammaproteobacteria bacterium]|nr:hypothetical protein [Gammaproteobacteria bacterium]
EYSWPASITQIASIDEANNLQFSIIGINSTYPRNYSRYCQENAQNGPKSAFQPELGTRRGTR